MILDFSHQCLVNTFPQFQMYGHSRSPSREYKELTKRDALIQLNLELDKLRKTADISAIQSSLVDKEFDGFKDLFGKFLASETHDRVVWDKIEKLPADAVSIILLLLSTTGYTLKIDLIIDRNQWISMASHQRKSNRERECLQ